MNLLQETSRIGDFYLLDLRRTNAIDLARADIDTPRKRTWIRRPVSSVFSPKRTSLYRSVFQWVVVMTVAACTKGCALAILKLMFRPEHVIEAGRRPTGGVPVDGWAPRGGRPMKRITLAAIAAIALVDSAAAQAQTADQTIWPLLDDSTAGFVSVAEADFRSLGQGFDLPDGGRVVTGLAEDAPGGAFDPRDLARVPAEELGYKADWFVERYRRYNLDWDITGLRLTSLDAGASDYP